MLFLCGCCCCCCCCRCCCFWWCFWPCCWQLSFCFWCYEMVLLLLLPLLLLVVLLAMLLAMEFLLLALGHWGYKMVLLSVHIWHICYWCWRRAGGGKAAHLRPRKGWRDCRRLINKKMYFISSMDSWNISSPGIIICYKMIIGFFVDQDFFATK